MVSGLASGATFVYCFMHVILHFVELWVIQSFVFFCYFILHIHVIFHVVKHCHSIFCPFVCVFFCFLFFFLTIFIVIIFVFFCPLEMKCRHNGNLSQIFSILCSFNYRHQHCLTTCKLIQLYCQKTNILQAYFVRLERLKYNYKSAIDYYRSWIALHLLLIVHVVYCLFSLHWICFRSLYLFPVHDKV